MFLITGGAGFIGSNIINYLVDRGEEVVSVDWHNNISNKYFQNFNFKVIDPLSLHTFLKTNNILFGIELQNTLLHEDFTPFQINANAYG